ncbi:shikimate kinase [Bacteroidota bacterium]|nr:shikimate kinase [Bacteroidota bacterium]
MHIFLLGYMGCGKSFLSKKLSKVLTIDYFDLDNLVELKEKQTIIEIFEKKGESYFREIENLELNNLIKKNNKSIVATGGGTPCFLNNMKLMNKYGITIYLKKKPDLLFKSLLNSKKERPVFNSFKSKSEFFNNFKQREKFYNKSKIIIDCNFINEQEIIFKLNKILDEIRFKK